METTVYVHLTEERGYYLPFRLGEPATVSETNTGGGTIFIALGTWIARFIARCRRAIDRRWRTPPYVTRRVICAHGDLSRLARVSAKQPSIVRRRHGGRSFIAARSGHQSRPIATLVYLHSATTIRRVVACGRARARRYVARIPPAPTLCQLCNE